MTEDNQNQETIPSTTTPDNSEAIANAALTTSETIEAASDEIEVANLAMTIDVENLKPNSVLVIKIPIGNPMYFTRIHAAIVQGILMPRQEILKDKKIGVLFMTTEDSIELLSEEDMAKAGWVKKEPSLIIKP